MNKIMGKGPPAYLQIILVYILGFICGMLSVPAHAGIIEFTPPACSNLRELDHSSYYKWGINWRVPAGEYIQEAVLALKNVDNWIDEENFLYIYLLNSVPSGVHRHCDCHTIRDNFVGQGIHIATYSDESSGIPSNLTYRFSSLCLLNELTTYASDGNFGFGFDPDCHYLNDGFTFEVSTALIPEPPSVLLVAIALNGLFLFLIRNHSCPN